jgi:hypothetical protein
MSTREQIRDWFINKLKTIKVINGYRNDVKNVSKAISDLFLLRSFPVLVVYLGSENFEKPGEIFYYRTLNLTILGVSNISRDTNDSGKLIDANESLIEDVIKCINQNESELKSTFNITRAEFISIEPLLVIDEQILFSTIQINYRLTYVE